MQKFVISVFLVATSLSAPARAEDMPITFMDVCQRLTQYEKKLDGALYSDLLHSRFTLMEPYGVSYQEDKDYTSDQCQEVYGKLKTAKSITLGGLDVRIASDFQSVEEVVFDRRYTRLENLAQFPNLRKAVLNPAANVYSLTDTALATLPNLPKLEALEIFVDELTVFSHLERLPTLKDLTIVMTGAKDLSWLKRFNSIERLKIRTWATWYSDAMGRFDFDILASLPKLKGLSLDNIELPHRLSVIGRIDTLESLEIVSGHLYTLEGLHNLKRLKSVRLADVSWDCDYYHKCNYPKLGGLNQIPSLESLALEGAPGFLDSDLSRELNQLRLPSLKRLKTVNVTYKEGLLQASPLLEDVFSRNWGPSALREFKHNPKLKSLSLQAWTNDMHLGELEANPALGLLDFSRGSVKNGSDLKGLSKLKNLRELRISQGWFNDISILEASDSLQRLDLSRNGYFGNVAGLEKFKSLKWLDISCNEVSDLTPLQDLINQGLQVVGFKTCSGWDQ